MTNRKLWLVLHLMSGGAWIGIDVVVAVLVAVGRFGGSPRRRGLAYEALGTFVVWPMLAAGLVCLVTGLVLGWRSRWGLLRYWWVVVKLGLNLALCTLILVALRPGMGDVRDYGAALAAGVPTVIDAGTLVFPPVVSLSALSLATVLAVYKPWGLVRRSRGTRASGRRSPGRRQPPAAPVPPR